jgi:hypothetical protein
LLVCGGNYLNSNIGVGSRVLREFELVLGNGVVAVKKFAADKISAK